MQSKLDCFKKGYGIRAGDRVGIMSSRRSGVLQLVDLLDRLSCSHVLLDPGQGLASLSSRIESNGVRLVFVCTESRAVAEWLSVCAGLADAFLERAPRD